MLSLGRSSFCGGNFTSHAALGDGLIVPACVRVELGQETGQDNVGQHVVHMRDGAMLCVLDGGSSDGSKLLVCEDVAGQEPVGEIEHEARAGSLRWGHRNTSFRKWG